MDVLNLSSWRTLPLAQPPLLEINDKLVVIQGVQMRKLSLVLWAPGEEGSTQGSGRKGCVRACHKQTGGFKKNDN